MRKLIFAAVGLLMFSLTATATAQGGSVASSWSGVFIGRYCAPCVGELVTCDSFISLNQGVFHVLAGICNDFDPSETPCAGRYTWYTELCFDSAAVEAGSLLVFYGVGKQRSCFNETAEGAGACAKPDPGDIILEASTLEQARIDTRGLAAGYNGEDSVTDVTTTSFFDPMDGKEKLIPPVSTVNVWTSETDFVEPFCSDFAFPCGTAGQEVIVGAPEPPRGRPKK